MVAKGRVQAVLDRVRPILDRMKNTGDPDKHHGHRLRYANPFNGGWSGPTMGAHLALLPKGFKGKDYRSTDGTIFVCVEGEGTTRIEDENFDWGPNDVFVIVVVATFGGLVIGMFWKTLFEI